jgi:hypothetical protein
MTFKSLTLYLCMLVTLGATEQAEAAKKISSARKPAGQALEAQVNEKLSGSDCFASAAELMRKWKISRDWIVRPSDLDGGKIFASPAGETGVWVEVAFYPNHSVELLRASPDALVRARWRKADCAPQLETHTVGVVPAKALSFTDQDAAKMVKSGDSFLFYFWSPHMPLSVTGFPEAREMASKLKLKFVPLLDPEADAVAVQDAVKEQGIPAGATRRPSSVELSYRGVGIHYPATLVLSRGKFSRIYPGYWTTPDELESFIRGSL